VVELPPVLTMRDLMRLVNLGVPEPFKVSRKQMRRHLTDKGLPVKEIELAELGRVWPELVASIWAGVRRWKVRRAGAVKVAP
jgi:hypothetical protein